SPLNGMIYARAWSKGKKLFFQMRDQGSGIPEEHKEKIFQPFFTLGIDGSGLGLFLCERIVGNAGGRISFRREARETVFEVVVPG
ncbi:MAG: HAMP domain-containing sensor histidine kinase, partial [Candidatus Wallbacteria bacterium]|nr:HAMP domain-containing sensor histidine kinase [Candidatus Wallbacteria bacterium]